MITRISSIFVFDGVRITEQIIQNNKLIDIAYLYWSKLLKIYENDKNASVNIFQGIIDTIVVVVFVGCYTPLGPLLTQIS